MDESHESGTELVVAGGDAPELFELVEEALDIVAFTIECLGPTKALLAPDHVGDVGDGSARLDVNAQAIGVIAQSPRERSDPVASWGCTCWEA